MSLESLSPRERQCLERAARHTPRKLIASELNIEVGTIDGYLTSAARKLGVSRREALQMMLDQAHPGFPGEGIPGVEVPTDPIEQKGGSRFPWPFPTPGRPDNDLNTTQTVIAIMVAASLLLAALALTLLATKIISHPG